MKLKQRIVIVLSLVIFCFQVKAQDVTLDSLKNILKNAKHDTTRCIALSDLIGTENDDKIWPLYNEQLLKIAEKGANNSSLNNKEKIFYLEFLADALNNKGYLSSKQGDIPKALEYYNSSIKIKEKAHDKKGIAAILNNLGSIYMKQGDIPKALDYMHRSLKIQEEIDDKNGIAYSLNNIATIYINMKDYTNALAYFTKSLKIKEGLKNKMGVATTLNNIAAVYTKQNNLSKALEFHQKSLTIREQIKDKLGIANSLVNMGGIYFTQGNTTQALKNFQLGLKMQEEILDKTGASMTLISIAELLLQKGKPKEALSYASRSLQLGKELNFPENIRRSAFILRKIYKDIGNYKEAYKMYELETQMNEKIYSAEAKKEAIRKQIQYVFEKKAAADSVLNAQERIVKNAELKAKNLELTHEKTKELSLYGGLTLVLIFSFFLYKRYKVIYNQKEIISLKEQETNRQKILLEVKNKEIVDSITYAKRIQSAILPPAKIVKECLKESFILYKPRNIVAGDFYWMEQIQNGIIFAAADCTGHGVPGAMVSVVCNNALNRSVREYGLVNPGEILDKTRELVISEFKKSDDEMKDGMDISLCKFEFEPTNDPQINWNGIKLRWSGANNPLWIIRENKIIEHKGDKQPIGFYIDPKPFTTHLIELQQNDIIYIFTDGYQDQFGGSTHFENGKKIKTSRMKELFLSISHKPMNEQKDIIDQFFEDWKRNLDQVDDVCVIGVRI